MHTIAAGVLGQTQTAEEDGVVWGTVTGEHRDSLWTVERELGDYGHFPHLEALVSSQDRLTCTLKRLTRALLGGHTHPT